MIFGKKVIPEFTSKSQAFDYMFSLLVDKGKDMMDAAQQANNFAELIAQNKKLPDIPPKPLTPLEQGLNFVKQVSTIKTENPDIWEMLTSVAGGLVSTIAGTGAKLEDPPFNDIDFENLN